MSWRKRRTENGGGFDRRRYSSIDISNEMGTGIPPPNGPVITEPRPASAGPSESPVHAENSSQPPPSELGSPSASDDPPVPLPQDQNTRHHRFSILRFRNASDPQLSTRAKQQALQDAAPPVPNLPTPAIITTAPTLDMSESSTKKKQRFRLTGKPRLSEDSHADSAPVRTSLPDRTPETNSATSISSRLKPSRVTFDAPNRSSIIHDHDAPPAYGDEGRSSLPIPAQRLSDSSRSDGSSSGPIAYATTTTTHISTTTTFFRLPRRKKKDPGPLFPLPDKVHRSKSEEPPEDIRTISSLNVDGGQGQDKAMSESTENVLHSASEHVAAASADPTAPQALAATSMKFAAPGAPPILRTHSTASARSSQSTPSSLAPPGRLTRKGRSSTMSSLNGRPPQEATPISSGRTSTSTIGRSHLGNLLNLSQRFRQQSEPGFPHRDSNAGPGTPGSSTSKQNSFSLNRSELIIVPDREEGDTPAKYLVRLQEAITKSVIASVLSRSADQFSLAVLRSYMRRFSFFGDPIDMAIRKLLMEVELPKETQQIDRVLQGFADRYHECNPGIFMAPDQAYFVAFSILILHTDVFNKNNKRKMQKADYIKNTQTEGISEDILGCFYDNIAYTPFIHVEDDLDVNGEKILLHRGRKNLFARNNSDPLKKMSREPVDPYTLILDRRLDILRPNLRDVMILDDPYSYLGTADSLNTRQLHKAFFKSAVLQIVSLRSRPDAFMSPMTISNPEEAHPGVVDIKVTKVGIVWRKDPKKKKARSPWQEWGAILTGSQLYFFRNATWAKGLVHQYEAHYKHGDPGAPVIFKPPLDEFKPEAQLSTDNAVALLDMSYKKHKHAFVFVRHGGLEEVFLATNENEMNDWIAKINYSAAFRSAGVRMRGVSGANDGQKNRTIKRLNTDSSTNSTQAQTVDVPVETAVIDNVLLSQILAARRQIIVQKIAEAEEKLAAAWKQLEIQLRNARHLQILAPIQAKTREEVIYAAARMAAKLKWIRMEIWRLKCHKDILMLDLEEEQNPKPESVSQVSKIPAGEAGASPERHKPILGRFASKASSNSSNQKLSKSPPSLVALSHSNESDFNMDHMFESRHDISQESHRTSGHAAWKLPPLSFDNAGKPGLSPLKSLGQSQVGLEHRRSAASIVTEGDEASQASGPPPSVDGADKKFSITETISNEKLNEERNRPESAADVEEESEVSKTTDGDKGDVPENSSKVRRSLHRTLRDSQISVHSRSKKGKDSSSTTGHGDEIMAATEAEGLPRTTGSFTVHGKKASVITFGSEWQSLAPEERLKSRKPAPSTEDAKVSHTLETISPELLSSEAVRRASAVSLNTELSSIPPSVDQELRAMLPEPEDIGAEATSTGAPQEIPSIPTASSSSLSGETREGHGDTHILQETRSTRNIPDDSNESRSDEVTFHSPQSTAVSA